MKMKSHCFLVRDDGGPAGALRGPGRDRQRFPHSPKAFRKTAGPVRRERKRDCGPAANWQKAGGWHPVPASEEGL